MKVLAQGRERLEIDYPQYLLKSVGIFFLLTGVALAVFLILMPNQVTPRRPWFFLFPLIFAGIGLFLALFTETVRVLFDKASQQVSFYRETLFQKKSHHLPLNQVKEVIIQETQSARSQTMYRVAIRLDDGREVPLIETYDTFLKSKIIAVHQISEFLGLQPHIQPYEEKERRSQKVALGIFLLGLLIIVGVLINMHFK